MWIKTWRQSCFFGGNKNLQWSFGCWDERFKFGKRLLWATDIGLPGLGRELNLDVTRSHGECPREPSPSSTFVSQLYSNFCISILKVNLTWTTGLFKILDCKNFKVGDNFTAEGRRVMYTNQGTRICKNKNRCKFSENHIVGSGGAPDYWSGVKM